MYKKDSYVTVFRRSKIYWTKKETLHLGFNGIAEASYSTQYNGLFSLSLNILL